MIRPNLSPLADHDSPALDTALDRLFEANETTNPTQAAREAQPVGDTTFNGVTAKVYRVPGVPGFCMFGFPDVVRWSLGMPGEVFALGWSAWRGGADELQPAVFGESAQEIDGREYEIEVLGVDCDDSVVAYRVREMGGVA